MVKRKRGFSGSKTTLVQLKELGVNTKICAYCKGDLKLRLHQHNDIPMGYLFVNKVQDIYALLHRKCKKPYLENKRL